MRTGRPGFGPGETPRRAPRLDDDVEEADDVECFLRGSRGARRAEYDPVSHGEEDPVEDAGEVQDCNRRRKQ